MRLFLNPHEVVIVEKALRLMNRVQPEERKTCEHVLDRIQSLRIAKLVNDSLYGKMGGK